jgi:hypothetical protein
VHTGTNDSNVTTLLKLSFATFSNKNWAMCSNTDGTVSGTRQIEHQTQTQLVMKQCVNHT